MEVRGQIHAPAALLPVEIAPSNLKLQGAVLPEKLAGPHLVKKFLAFYTT
jgi:hypothetical protein